MGTYSHNEAHKMKTFTIVCISMKGASDVAAAINNNAKRKQAVAKTRSNGTEFIVIVK